VSTSKQRLDKLLLERGLVDSRSKATAMILAGKVRVDGRVVVKAGTLVSLASSLEVMEQERWVSRGAHKLLKALSSFDVDPEDAVCIDVGASTGGFTQVLLERGAKKVYAIDVGYGQLAWPLRQDKRVVVRERTNARFLRREDFDETADLVTIDVSFISLKLIIPVVVDLLSPNGDIIALIKPQFEAGKEHVSKGIISDPLLHESVLRDITGFIEQATPLKLAGLTHSPIKGPKGNIEFLMHVTNKRVTPYVPDFEKIVKNAHDELD